MYHEFYNMALLPFENTPDPRFFFASEQHREALAAIEYTIRMRKGFVLITGSIGAGKTTVGRTMCRNCGDRAAIVHVSWGHQEREGLLRQILRSLHVPSHRGEDHARMLDRLHEHLQQQMRANRPVVLLVDEAQTLSDEALDELRLLSNFDSTTDKMIQIVLVGQPELRQRLRGERHAALRQRIVMAKQLQPLGLADTHAYIDHRLRAASNDPQNVGVVFDSDAIHEIYGVTGGIPRLINVACDNCLLLGYVRESYMIGPGIVQRVLEDMVPNLEQQESLAFKPEPQYDAEPERPMRLAGNF